MEIQTLASMHATYSDSFRPRSERYPLQHQSEPPWHRHAGPGRSFSGWRFTLIWYMIYTIYIYIYIQYTDTYVRTTYIRTYVRTRIIISFDLWIWYGVLQVINVPSSRNVGSCHALDESSKLFYSDYKFTPNLRTKILPTKICWLKLSGKFPRDDHFTPQNLDSAWVKSSEIQNLSTEIGRNRVYVPGCGQPRRVVQRTHRERPGWDRQGPAYPKP